METNGGVEENENVFEAKSGFSSRPQVQASVLWQSVVAVVVQQECSVAQEVVVVTVMVECVSKKD